MVAALTGQRKANQAATLHRHEIYDFRSYLLGGYGQVAFVFTVFVVNDHEHAAGADIFDGLWDGRELLLTGFPNRVRGERRFQNRVHNRVRLVH